MKLGGWAGEARSVGSPGQPWAAQGRSGADSQHLFCEALKKCGGLVRVPVRHRVVRGHARTVVGQARVAQEPELPQVDALLVDVLVRGIEATASKYM